MIYQSWHFLDSLSNCQPVVLIFIYSLLGFYFTFIFTYFPPTVLIFSTLYQDFTLKNVIQLLPQRNYGTEPKAEETKTPAKKSTTKKATTTKKTTTKSNSTKKTTTKKAPAKKE